MRWKDRTLTLFLRPYRSFSRKLWRLWHGAYLSTTGPASTCWIQTIPKILVLGPFWGDPTPHVRIPVTQGICGAAVACGETVIVDDVASDPRYLSCSIETRSEIVVPLYANGRIVGEIDIDSHDPAAFGEEDRIFLEEVSRIVGDFINGVEPIFWLREPNSDLIRNRRRPSESVI